jgi:hypothetical protein
MQLQLKALFEKLRANAAKIAEREFGFADSYLKDSAAEGIQPVRISQWKERLGELRNVSKKDSLFDYWEAAEEAFYLERDIATGTAKHLSGVVSQIQPQISSLTYKAAGWKAHMDRTRWIKVVFWLSIAGFVYLEATRGKDFPFWYSAIGLYAALALVSYIQTRYFRVRKRSVMRHAEQRDSALKKIRFRTEAIESRGKDIVRLRAKIVEDTLGLG